ncbi:MAG: hypothetical protein ACI9WU_002648 [Myxococcota bacterium]
MPPAIVEVPNNDLRITGQVCTQPPEEVVFPVKVLFIADQSTSLQLCTDPQKRRFAAMSSVIEANAAQPNVLFGFIGFSSWVRTQKFTKDPSKMKPYLDAASGLGPATDYQGALATAIKMLEEDMLESGPIRARTRYVVIFVTDGIPEPRCNAGCEDDLTSCANGEDDDGDGLIDDADDSCQNLEDTTLHPDTLYGQCNTTKEIGKTDYVDYPGSCPDYNQSEQIMQRLSEILALKDVYSAGSVTFHSVYLFTDDPQILDDESCALLFGYSAEPARALLTQMAALGGGTFRDVNLTEDVSQSFQFDFSTLEAPQWLTDFMAVNASARMVNGVLEPDSDMDGLSDPREKAAGTRFDKADTDGDGYGDLAEWAFATLGFDAVDPNAPAVPCGQGLDLDGDRLPDCVEGFMGTDPRGPDTDADGLVDWLEVAAGTDPLVPDAGGDPDFDGVLTREELRGGTDPLTADPLNWKDERTRYDLKDLGETEDGRRCYAFDVDGLGMAVTPILEDLGRNRILLYSLERPVTLITAAPTAQVACIEARYEGEAGKTPLNGHVDVGDAFWKGLREELGPRLVDIEDCIDTEPDFRLSRTQLDEVITDCLPGKLAVGGYLRTREELLALTHRYLDPNVQPLFPRTGEQLFVPLEQFDPTQHCHRPGDVDALIELIQRAQAVCRSCKPKL